MNQTELNAANRLWWLLHITLKGTEAQRREAFKIMYSNLKPLNLERAEPCRG